LSKEQGMFGSLTLVVVPHQQKPPEAYSLQ
jgi:hypothetical protein